MLLRLRPVDLGMLRTMTMSSHRSRYRGRQIEAFLFWLPQGDQEYDSHGAWLGLLFEHDLAVTTFHRM